MNSASTTVRPPADKPAFFVQEKFPQARSRSRQLSFNQSKENQFLKQMFLPQAHPTVIDKNLILAKVNSFNNSNVPSFLINKLGPKRTPDKQGQKSMLIARDELSRAEPLSHPTYKRQSQERAVSKSKRKMVQILSRAKLSFDKNVATKGYLPNQLVFSQNHFHKHSSCLDSNHLNETNFDVHVFLRQMTEDLVLIEQRAKELGHSRLKVIGLTIKKLKHYQLLLAAAKWETEQPHVKEIQAFLHQRVKECEILRQKHEEERASAGVQTSPRPFDPAGFIEACKSYAAELLKKGFKGEFKLADMIGYLEGKGFAFDELDFEAQKLLKNFCDCIQKQLIFEGVIKILEEENINLEEYIQIAYERVMKQLVQEASVAQEPTVVSQDSLTFSSNKHADDQQIASFNIDEKATKKNLCLDLKLLNREIVPDKTPKGFHQEFYDMAEDFSLSWRQQIKKEQQKRQQNK